ncbi:MAG TPA: TetR/AcrR family transcriptional regulator [Bacteroidales bacterium]
MDKPSQIINTAKELFKTYGYAKTTMTDIADHLEISKALLYYYFTDKESIFMALAKQEQIQFIEEINKLTTKSSDAKSMLLEYAGIRFELLQKMITLILSNDTFDSIRPFFRDNALEFKEKEISLIKEILQKGILSGEFINLDVEEYANLYINILRGLINAIFSKFDQYTITQEKTELFLNQARLFTNMFINSISK